VRAHRHGWPETDQRIADVEARPAQRGAQHLRFARVLDQEHLDRRPGARAVAPTANASTTMTGGGAPAEAQGREASLDHRSWYR
jgi:hypothetical protein